MICQFCGKQVGDNDKICKYCGSNLKAMSAHTKSTQAQMRDSDMTVAMPTAETTKSVQRGFESSRAVQRSAEGADGTHMRSGARPQAGRQNEYKRQYYRYNPNAENGQRRGGNTPRSTARSGVPKYTRRPGGGHGVLKWIGKIILLAIVGISVGILIYLGTTSVSNMIKSIGNHGAPASVSTPVPNNTDTKSNAESSAASTKNSDTETKSDSGEKAADSSNEKKNSSSNKSESVKQEEQSTNSRNEEKQTSTEDSKDKSSSSESESTSSERGNEESESNDFEGGDSSSVEDELDD